jgi:hypothetical protein
VYCALVCALWFYSFNLPFFNSFQYFLISSTFTSYGMRYYLCLMVFFLFPFVFRQALVLSTVLGLANSGCMSLILECIILNCLDMVSFYIICTQKSCKVPCNLPLISSHFSCTVTYFPYFLYFVFPVKWAAGEIVRNLRAKVKQLILCSSIPFLLLTSLFPEYEAWGGVQFLHLTQLPFLASQIIRSGIKDTASLKHWYHWG